MTNFYHWYIQHSVDWLVYRGKVFDRATTHNGGKCEICRIRAFTLCHHVDYSRVGHEKMSDCLALDDMCHRTISGKREEGDPTIADIRRFLEFFDPEALGIDPDE